MYAVSLKTNQKKKKSKKITSLPPVCFINHQQEPPKILSLAGEGG